MDTLLNVQMLKEFLVIMFSLGEYWSPVPVDKQQVEANSFAQVNNEIRWLAVRQLGNSEQVDLSIYGQ